MPGLVDDAGPVAFLRLAVSDSKGRVVGSNFYWLSRAPEVLAWDRSTWYVTPTESFADFTALQRLPPTRLALEPHSDRRGEDTVTSVVVHNVGPALAFFVRVEVAGAGGEEVLPVRWDDNCISLLPGERQTLTARYRTRDLGGVAPVVRATGWNVVG